MIVADAYINATLKCIFAHVIYASNVIANSKVYYVLNTHVFKGLKASSPQPFFIGFIFLLDVFVVIFL